MSSSIDQQPGGYGPPPGDGYDARPTSVAAIIGLVGAFVFWPVGLVASIVGISHTKPGRKKGRGLATAGLIISVIAAVIAIVVVVAIVGAASSPSVQRAVSDAASSAAAADPDQSDDSAAAPAAGSPESDVVIDSCDVGAGGIVQGEAVVTNSTSRAATYLITVSGNDGDGNRVAELTGAANAVAPGQSAQVQLIGTAGDADTSDLECVVANVTRA